MTFIEYFDANIAFDVAVNVNVSHRAANYSRSILQSIIT